MTAGAILAAVTVLGGSLALIWRLVGWAIDLATKAVKNVEELRTQDARLNGLTTAVAERDGTIKTLRDEVRRADAGVKVAKEQFNEILETLAADGSSAGVSDRINAALDRLSALPTAAPAPAAEDR